MKSLGGREFFDKVPRTLWLEKRTNSAQIILIVSKESMKKLAIMDDLESYTWLQFQKRQTRRTDKIGSSYTKLHTS